VDAIADAPTSSVALAIQEVTRQKKRLFLGARRGCIGFDREDVLPYG
jgi:hypothetical protein